MNKSELVDAVAVRIGDKRTALAAVEAVLDTVTRAVTAGERVALSGFGVFEKVDRAARSARNPATGGTVDVAATSIPRFRAGQTLKAVVSGQRELSPLSEAPDAPPVSARIRAPRTAAPPAPAAAPPAPAVVPTASAPKASTSPVGTTTKTAAEIGGTQSKDSKGSKAAKSKGRGKKAGSEEKSGKKSGAGKKTGAGRKAEKS